MQFDKNNLIGLIIGGLIVASVSMALFLYPLTQNQKLPIIKQAPDFSLINQDNETVTLNQLQGKVLMLGFIYTNCEDECFLMTSHFKSIQNELGSILGSQVMLIFITLDPLHDRPAILKSYAEQWGANLSGWQFLTAYDLETIKQVIEDYGVISYTNVLEELINTTDDNTSISYKITNDNDTQPSILIHSWVSMLIDQNLMIRKVYTKVNWILSVAINDITSLL
ncbi:MAG: SCO family protein [Candidatus Hodarchaeota archaeon]